MKWSKYNVLFHSEKLGHVLFNSRMLSLSVVDKESYELLKKQKKVKHVLKNVSIQKT